MAKETERKYLVLSHLLPSNARSEEMIQAYIVALPDRSLRVRIVGEKAWITLKTGNKMLQRDEYEYEIPVADAREMLQGPIEGSPIEKTRYYVDYGGFTWEVDRFHCTSEGLWLAEIELKHPQEEFPIPPWVGVEVTGDVKYLNSYLAKHPFTEWE